MMDLCSITRVKVPLNLLISKKAGYSKIATHAGTVTFIQRFSSAPNLNVHMQMSDRPKVVITDFDYGDVDIETEIL